MVYKIRWSNPQSLIKYAASGDDEVDTPSLAWREQADNWDPIADLLGGTPRMRAVGPKWLPPEEAEEQDDYKVRLQRAYLYEAFKDTVEKLLSKPFSQPVGIKGTGLPAKLKPFENDVDGCGSNLTKFASELMRHALRWGIAHVMVHYSDVEGMRRRAAESGQPIPTIAGKLTEQARQSFGVRPYMRIVPGPALISASPMEDGSGNRRPGEVRIRECVRMRGGNYGEIQVEQVWRYTPGAWEVWRRMPREKKYQRVGSGTTAPLKLIPIATLNLLPADGYMKADPPLQPIGWLNIAHWASASDQRNIVHVARVPILHNPGSSENDPDIVIGSKKAIKNKNPDAKLLFVEHTGKAIEAGQRDLDELENHMEALGMEPYRETASNMTAAAETNDENRTVTKMQSWVRLTEACMDEALGHMADFEGESIPEDTGVDIFDRFSIASRVATDMPQILTMHERKLLRDVTVVQEAQRRNLVSESIVPEDEVDGAREDAMSVLDSLPPAPVDPGTEGPDASNLNDATPPKKKSAQLTAVG